MNRKDFFKTGGRLLLLGGISASTTYLFVNKKVTAACSVSPSCKNCGIYSDCVNLEIRQNYRTVQKTRNNDFE